MLEVSSGCYLNLVYVGLSYVRLCYFYVRLWNVLLANQKKCTDDMLQLCNQLISTYDKFNERVNFRNTNLNLKYRI